MRRWNGWGDAAVTEPLRPEARAFLAQAVGPAEPPRDATLEQALQRVAAQASRLPPHPRVDTGAAARLGASFGQSAFDWLRLRFGEVGRVTDGVASPEHAGEVRELLDWAAAVGASVMPCGGATSVVGHLTPAGPRPVLTLHLGRMGRLLGLDRPALLATFEAGVAGPQLEAQLRAHGLTLGHFPQSFEYSTPGGWIATRSSGQQSARYGRIEQLLAGATLLLRRQPPHGRIAAHPPLPRLRGRAGPARVGAGLPGAPGRDHRGGRTRHAAAGDGRVRRRVPALVGCG